ncbi:MAG TPA: hypothetical protein VH877_32040, partial [Polyangia bacterium]|nr:hypothetical protein [Polyangia bacterium]
MPLEHYETSVNFAGGKVICTFDIKPVLNEPTSSQLPFEVRFYGDGGTGPFLLVNPSLDITLFQRTEGGGRWLDKDCVRLPITPGDLGETGGIVGEDQSMTWRPFASLSSEMVLRLDALRHIEFGMSATLKLFAGLIPLSSSNVRPGIVARPTPLRCRHDFVVTNEQWRELLEMMGWPRPRVFELQPLSFSDLAEFAEAQAKLREAERQLFLGHWSQSIAASRIVVEAVFRKLGYKGDKSYKWEQIEAAGLPPEMSQVFKALNHVTNLEHHPTGQDHHWQRADARFLLQLA